MKRIVELALLLMVALGPAWAQQTSPDETPATKEDIQKLFTTMHIREQMRNIMDLMAKQSKQMAQDTLKKKIPDTSQKELDRLNAMMDQTMKGFDIDGMIDDIVPVYQRHLTKTDVAAMAGFYQTPTGQKMLREQPQMTAEAMQAVQPRMEKMMATVMDDAEKMAKEASADAKDAKTAK
jgi:hypothetical protein